MSGAADMRPVPFTTGSTASVRENSPAFRLDSRLRHELPYPGELGLAEGRELFRRAADRVGAHALQLAAHVRGAHCTRDLRGELHDQRAWRAGGREHALPPGRFITGQEF